MKANSRKTSNKSLEAKYKRQPTRVARRKDANVRRSSHGKFTTVAELVAHQRKVEEQRPKKGKRVAA